MSMTFGSGGTTTVPLYFLARSQQQKQKAQIKSASSIKNPPASISDNIVFIIGSYGKKIPINISKKALPKAPNPYFIMCYQIYRYFYGIILFYLEDCASIVYKLILCVIHSTERGRKESHRCR